MQPDPNPSLAKIQSEAAAIITRELKEIEARVGLAGAVAAAQGMVAAMVTWSEDIVGMSLREALKHPLNRHDGKG